MRLGDIGPHMSRPIRGVVDPWNGGPDWVKFGIKESTPNFAPAVCRVEASVR